MSLVRSRLVSIVRNSWGRFVTTRGVTLPTDLTTTMTKPNGDRSALIPFSSRLFEGRALAQDVWSIFACASLAPHLHPRLTPSQRRKSPFRLHQPWPGVHELSPAALGRRGCRSGAQADFAQPLLPPQRTHTLASSHQKLLRIFLQQIPRRRDRDSGHQWR